MGQLPSFVQVVVAARDLLVVSTGAHVCRLAPRQSALAWHCDLDDGTPTDDDRDPASFGRLAGRSSGRTGHGSSADRFVYTDPLGIIDAPLRERMEHWPPAPHGDGVTRPAELWSVQVNGEGLVVESVSWWDSAAALDHQIGLAIDLADRLAALP